MARNTADANSHTEATYNYSKLNLEENSRCLMMYGRSNSIEEVQIIELEVQEYIKTHVSVTGKCALPHPLHSATHTPLPHTLLCHTHSSATHTPSAARSHSAAHSHSAAQTPSAARSHSAAHSLYWLSNLLLAVLDN